MSKFNGWLSGAAAFAMVAGPLTVAAPTDGWSQVDELIVTVRKREENLQDVPIAVGVFDSVQIERQGISDIGDIAKYTPSVQFDNNFGPLDNRVTIRGLSQTRGRPSAAILVDGIDVTSESVSFNGTGTLITQRLLDVERVEIVKGPQSALYGRSAFNGAIQYVTRNPSLEEFEFRGGFDVGNYGRYSVNGSVGGPVISDVLAVSINGLWWQEDGFYEHPATLEDLGGGEGWGIAGTLLFEPTDAITVRARVEYADDEFDDVPRATIRHNRELLAADPANGASAGCTGGVFSGSTCSVARIHPLFIGQVPDGNDLKPTISLDPRTGGVYPGAERDYFRATLFLEWDLDVVLLDSWTGFTRGGDKFLNEGDYDAEFVGPVGNQNEISLRGQEHDFEDEIEQFSQEFRLSTNLEGPFQFTLGGLYWFEKVEQLGNSKFSDFIIPIAFGPPGCCAVDSATDLFPLFQTRRSPVGRKTNHGSVYGMAEWDITEQWKFTAELRYTREETTVTGNVPAEIPCFDSFGFPCFGPSFPDLTDLVFAANGFPTASGKIRLQPVDRLMQSSKGDFLTPRVVVEWSPTDDLLTYFSVGRGVKPGGISAVSSGTFSDADGDGTFNELTFERESLWSYEVGLKATWLDGTLQTNLDAFYQTYKNKQVGSRGIIPPATVETGLILNAGEGRLWGFEADVLWQPDDHWTFGVQYTFLDTKYTDFEFASTSSMAALRAGNCTVQPSESGGVECLVSLTGNQFERTPKHALTLLSRYEQPLFNTDMNWFVEGNGIYQGKRFIDESNIKQLDSYWVADFRVGVTSERWDFLVYLDNAFNDDTVKTAVDAGGDVDATLTPGTFASTFSPADNVIATLPDPQTWGVRANVRF